MDEKKLVNAIYNYFFKKGYKVAREVANFHRSADIVVIDDNNCILVVECKVSDIKRAITQLSTHKLSADKVYIGTVYRKTRKDTLNKIKEAGLGLIYVLPDQSIDIVIDEDSKKQPLAPAKNKMLQKLKEMMEC